MADSGCGKVFIDRRWTFFTLLKPHDLHLPNTATKECSKDLCSVQYKRQILNDVGTEMHAYLYVYTQTDKHNYHISCRFTKQGWGGGGSA